jgi:serine/threonine-protein kinase PpkA
MVAIAGYQVERELGRGGMAVVYLALHEMLERQVALKVLMNTSQAEDANWRARFLREGRLVAKLCHRHIVTVYDLGITAGLPYIAMEYLPGGDLKRRVGQGKVRQHLQIIGQLAQALASAHRQQFIHRDLKPQNVLFRATGEAVLTDFGIAKQQGDSSLTRPGLVIGTVAYISPEQARGYAVDGRADLYSLGVLSYELLTGRLPFYAETELGVVVQHLTASPPPLPAELSYLQPLLDRLLAKDPNARYPDAGALLADLQPLIHPPGQGAKLTKAEQPAAPPPAAPRAGDSVPVRDDLAVLRTAALAGLASAQRALGIAYFLGQGVAQDYAQARQWLQQAVAQQDAEAAYYLGRLYEHGLGGATQSDTQAAHYYREAATHGYYPAFADLERFTGESF